MAQKRVGGVDLWVEEGGSGEPVLLLMHGLSGTGALWDGTRDFLEREWPGRWIIPDLRGHGRSGHAAIYGIAQHAADMAELVWGAERLFVAGHSMGGLVGMTLACGWFGVQPEACVTVGVKVNWTEEEYAAVARIATTATRWFDTREEALERFVLVSGLKGVVDPASDMAATGIAEEGGKYRLAADNRTAIVATASMPAIHAAARAPIVLSRGEHDGMVSIDELHALDPAAIEFSGLGHNAHVENPEPFWRLIAKAAGL